MPQYTIYHNARCSKSRGAHQILEDAGVDFVERLYLDNPPSEKELRNICDLLGTCPIDLVRTGEQEWKDAGLSADSSDEEIVTFIAKHPKVLERPIIIKDNEEAVIGRPPENVETLL